MNTFEAIEQRRAVKHYDPNHEMTNDEVNQLLSAVLLSPTSFNIQNWRFVLVKDKPLREKLREAAWNQAQVTDASLVVVLCGNKNSWSQEPDRYWRNAPDDVREFLVAGIKNFYDGKEQEQRDEIHRSCGIAAQTLMLSAKAMGYDSCPMVGFEPEKVAELINLPKDHVISLMVVVGKAIKPARERGGQLSLNEVVIENQFS